MKKLSIVGKNPHAEEHVGGFYNAGDRIRHWGKTGALWGWIWGTVDEAARAREILKGTNPAELHTHPLKQQEPEYAVATT